jgi:NADH-quinone oxidoreductase subunit G
VGSLLSKDFLHKARAWELDKTAGICTGCSQGCNVEIETRDNAVVRLKPRPNLEVNRYFLCDHGRADYRWMNRGDRIEAPLVAENGEHMAVDWDHALARAAQIVKGAGGKAVALVSPGASNEALYLLQQVVAGFETTGGFRVERVAGETPLAGVPDLALREERAPNVTGATLLGYREGFDDAVTAIADASLVIVLDEALDGVAADVLERAGNVIYLGTALPEAARAARVVLPTTNVAEEDGTFVNRDRRVQRYLQAKAAPGMARPAWWILGELLAELDRGEPLGSAAEAFAQLAANESAFEGLTYTGLGYRGTVLGRGSPVEVSR